MIIQMDEFSVIEQDFSDDALDYRHLRGNALRAPQFNNLHAPSPDLPDHFDNFNAKEFIDRAHALATQI